jgi:hypothetical protein
LKAQNFDYGTADEMGELYAQSPQMRGVLSRVLDRLRKERAED